MTRTPFSLLLAIALMLSAAAVWASGCESGASTSKSYHGVALPDPAAFNAHFGDMDTDGDGSVTRPEFDHYFPDTPAAVFTALDLNRNEGVDHDEWHAFKEAHGLRHHD